MRFFVNSDRYIYRDEDEDTISLMIKKSNQIIYLNKSAKKILGMTEKDIDLKDFVESLNIDCLNKEFIYKDYEEIIYQLESFGIITISNKDKDISSGCKIAGERNYLEVANFIENNKDNVFSYTSISNMQYYNPISIRSRQFNNTEYNLMYIRDERIISLLVVSLPPNTSGFSVIYLNSVFFENSIPEKECIGLLNELINFATKLFKDDFTKIRFHYFNTKQNWLLEQLKYSGFKKSCALEQEIDKNIKLDVYDKFFKED